MLWYYIMGIGGSAIFSLIVGYLLGNKTGHQQEQHSKEAFAASLDAEIFQKKQRVQKLTDLDESLSKKQKELERLNLMVADAHVNLDFHRQQVLASRMRDLDCQECALSEREKKLKENQSLLNSILHANHSDTPYFAKQYADCLYLIDLKEPHLN